VELQRLGKYQLVQRLAQGGMAELFLARAEGPGGFSKQLVVKRILPHLVSDPSFVDMFLGEARLAALLNHPNVVQTFDFGEAGGAYFLAMEFIDGPNLRMLLKAAQEGKAEPLSFALAARVVASACEGLSYVHGLADPDTGQPLGLVHRDISPENILVSRNGVVKVVDFGIAKAVGQAHKTKTGGVKGKLSYMAPEQLSSETLDGRADVYALGVVLYELLTGALPHDGEDEMTLMRAVLFEEPVPVLQRRPDVPRALAQVLDRALKRKRDERFGSCAELQAALEQYLRTSEELATAPQLAKRVAGWTPPVAAPPPSGSRPGSAAGSQPISMTALAFPSADVPAQPSFAAVLFTDIVGSTRYFEANGDTAGLAMVQRHNGLLFPCIERQGGRVVKTIGDAILAVFEDVGPAVRAALEVHETLERDAAAGHERIRVRAGLHAGVVLRHGDDIYGDVVNTAARVSSASKAGEVLVSRAVAEALPQGAPRPVARTPLTAKGKQAPVEVFCLREPDEAQPDGGGLSYVPCAQCGAPLRSESDFCDCQAGARLQSEAAKFEVRNLLFDLPGDNPGGAGVPAAPAAAPPDTSPFDDALDVDLSEPEQAPRLPADVQPVTPEAARASEESSGLELGFDPRKRRLVEEARAEAESAAVEQMAQSPEAPAPAWRPPPREQLEEGTLRRHADIRVVRRRNPWKGRLLVAGLLLLAGGAVAVVGLPPEQMQAVAEAWVKVKDVVVPAWERVAQLAVKGVGGQ
jgi:serine/threonine protein kinase